MMEGAIPPNPFDERCLTYAAVAATPGAMDRVLRALDAGACDAEAAGFTKPHNAFGCAADHLPEYSLPWRFVRYAGPALWFSQWGPE